MRNNLPNFHILPFRDFNIKLKPKYRKRLATIDKLIKKKNENRAK